jgi:uncharacterized protein YdhG (YjbR/CyaY superfamily)
VHRGSFENREICRGNGGHGSSNSACRLSYKKGHSSYLLRLQNNEAGQKNQAAIPQKKLGVEKMQQKPNPPTTIDEYIAGFPEDIQVILQKIRKTIKDAAPNAQETISYQMPTFKLHGNLVHFSAFKNHIGFYPVPSGIEKFKAELTVYKQGKGSVQFPVDQPIPFDLIRRIVIFRAEENLKKAAGK